MLSLLLRTDPPEMRGARLVQWCSLFGVADGTARVALSRMVERGELRARDGSYALAGRIERRRGSQDFSLAPRLGRWNGTWRTGIVRASARAAADRTELRDAMRLLHYAELREGVWTRPDNLPVDAATAEAHATASEQCQWWTGRPDDDAAALAARLFSTEVWATRAERLQRRLARATAALPHDDALAPAFVAGAEVVAHLRSDPLLPPRLGPTARAGDALRAGYRDFERAFATALRAWFRAHA
ncbi:MAG TPA: PaaX domain-containing protein, C- domain protein [Acidimicrobiia bacterium]|nr:PaaX domain-containing protein, C- domain protein [Acidimicrobiia bacterium]